MTRQEENAEGGEARPPVKVFLSHSHRDREFVRDHVLPRIVDPRIEPWTSGTSIRSAEHWERSIVRGLTASDWIVVVLSPWSVRSEWVRDEVHWALTHRPGRVIPLMIEPCDPTELHIRLARIQHLDLTRDRDAAGRQLLELLLGEPAVRPAEPSDAAPPAFDERRSRSEAPSPIVGRRAELDRLRQVVQAAGHGHRHVVLVSGEPGIGKTALVERFVGELGRSDWTVGRGQCVEHYGSGEPYLPILEAVGELARTALAPVVHDALLRQAPTWLTHLPALVADGEWDDLKRRCAGSTRERMLRELGEALETLTAARPVLLVLEDLHWSDPSTIDVLSHVVMRRTAARLAILATYRPADVAATGHPLDTARHDWTTRGACSELRLDALDPSEVHEYLATHLEEGELPETLSSAIHLRTGGHALFVTRIVEHLQRTEALRLVDGSWTVQQPLESLDVPGDIRRLIERQIGNLGRPEQLLLECAAAAGREFATATVAGAAEVGLSAAEDALETIARKTRVVRPGGLTEWPDGTVSGTYEFAHALYSSVIYERMAPARRVRAHERIARRLVQAYESGDYPSPGELATHFERAHAWREAMQHRRIAADRAVAAQADHEAVAHLRAALEHVDRIAGSDDRERLRLELHMALGAPLITTLGYASDEVAKTFQTALELCGSVDDTRDRVFALYGIHSYHLVRGELHKAKELGEQLLESALRLEDDDLVLYARTQLGDTLFWRGELGPATEQLRLGLDAYVPAKHDELTAEFGDHAGIDCLCHEALALCLQGRITDARERSRRARALARDLGQPFQEAFSLVFAAWLYRCLDIPDGAEAFADDARRVSEEYGFPHWAAASRVVAGWARAYQGTTDGAAKTVRDALQDYRATGAGLPLTFLRSMLVETLMRCGDVDGAVAELDETIRDGQARGERFFEAELLRRQGELTLRMPDSAGAPATDPPDDASGDVAEAHFRRALEVARAQGARLLELRAATSLGRLWRAAGRAEEATALVASFVETMPERVSLDGLEHSDGPPPTGEPPASH